MSHLSHLEQRLQTLIEGGFARLFSACLHPAEVAAQLAHQMDESAERTADGAIIAPHSYTVYLHPDDWNALTATEPDLPSLLAKSITELARRAGLHLRKPPAVQLLTDLTLPRRSFRAAVCHEEPTHSTQQIVLPGAAFNNPPPQKIKTAFVIYQGVHHPLNRPVTTIGRRRDNHLVLDDPRISRSHAQIRERFGSYSLFDAGSTSGTYVNGYRITECVLKPGDVISLGAVQLVYIEDDAPSQADGAFSDTQVRPMTLPPKKDIPEGS
ncbi:MAG: DUF3662 domain-containing protein [Anaerolineales bacterium]|nr:DUF3662 domain-containing protein [Anaerolineales bacterium]